MAFVKRAMLFSSVLACAQTPTRISKEHKAWRVVLKITAKTTTNFDSHLLIELIEDDWLFDLKKHIHKKLLLETGKINFAKLASCNTVPTYFCGGS